ncbi:hypothetical protein ACFP81_01380 [Deinococcus lacus]|uniref:Uncharacterized protein n=1 Tax=Deinococcus lacus TaxID=392561 RepID=A0ABW1YBH1_9DEIO
MNPALRSLPILSAFLAVAVLGYAALEARYDLMAACALILAALTFSISGWLRWVVLLAYPVAFLASLPLSAGLDGTELGTALLVMAGLTMMVYREQKAVRDLDWQMGVVYALRVGSERLTQARSEDEVIEAGVALFAGVQGAPNLAYVAYRGGSPQILAARGLFHRLLGSLFFQVTMTAAVCRPTTGLWKRPWPACPAPSARASLRCRSAAARPSTSGLWCWPAPIPPALARSYWVCWSRSPGCWARSWGNWPPLPNCNRRMT